MVAPLDAPANGTRRLRSALAVGGVLPALIVATYAAAEAATSGPLGHDALVSLGAKVNARIAAGEWWRLVTSVFLHADAAHVAFNALWLALFGAATASLLGASRALSAALLAGVAGQLASFAAGAGPSVGASGAVYGLAAALLWTAWRRRAALEPDLRWRVLASLAAATLVLIVAPFGFSAVDHAAHLGGFAAGTALAALPAQRPVALGLAGASAALLAAAAAAAWT